ncbi:MAG TPA: outer membrane protein assembly factor BamB [Gammaproteobacteria bacterium]|jgi:outer membrane protein assembly factor BamB|nr:outer membrane protein assembly factor BamB [Gammaproteobacteria bacterium]
MKKLLYGAVTALVLAACASDNVEPPALLKDVVKPEYKIQEAWTRSISSSDVVLGINLTIAHDDKDVYVAANSGKVYAFSLKSGGTDWSVQTGLTLNAGPVLGAGMLVVAGSGGTVLALNPADGTTLWKAELNGEVLANPAIGTGSVVMRTTDGRILALAADTGKLRWKTEYDVPRLTLRGACDPVIVDRMVLEGLDDGKLVALNLDDGTQMWEAVIASPKGSDELARLTDVDGRIAVDGDHVYAAGYRGQTLSVARSNGQVEWARDLTTYTGVANDAGNLYVTDLHSAVWALDRTSGVPVWTQPEMRAHNLTLPTPFLDTVAVGGIDGHIHLLSKKDGSEVARASMGSAPIVAPLVAIGNELLVLSTGGTVGAFLAVPAGD